MQWHCLSLSSSLTFSLPTMSSLSLQTLHSHNHCKSPFLHASLASINGCPSLHFNPLRLSLNRQNLMVKQRRRWSRVVCYSSAVLSPRNIQWASAVSAAILMLVKGTAINRSYLVPLFALQAPASIISWMQGDYGAWSAFLALLVRLFFFIPGELELPLITLLLVIVAPLQAMNLRGTQAGTVISLVIAAYLAFQHFTRAGGLQKSFNQGSIMATLAIICITIVPCLLLV